MRLPSLLSNVAIVARRWLFAWGLSDHDVAGELQRCKRSQSRQLELSRVCWAAASQPDAPSVNSFDHDGIHVDGGQAQPA